LFRHRREPRSRSRLSSSVLTTDFQLTSPPLSRVGAYYNELQITRSLQGGYAKEWNCRVGSFLMNPTVSVTTKSGPAETSEAPCFVTGHRSPAHHTRGRLQGLEETIGEIWSRR